eukprot:2624837-Rhodomonas_salina.1
MKWICAACAGVLPQWVVPSQEHCWAQSGCHERRNGASACGCQVSSADGCGRSRKDTMMLICISVCEPPNLLV